MGSKSNAEIYIRSRNCLEETAAFRVPELTEAGEIINTFKKYGIGKMSYSITQKQEEEEDE